MALAMEARSLRAREAEDPHSSLMLEMTLGNLNDILDALARVQACYAGAGVVASILRKRKFQFQIQAQSSDSSPDYP
jgi:hypothetical protein